MNNNIEQVGSSSKRLHIDRKMIGILSVFTVLGICLVISIVIATNTLSGLRSFATMQTHWTESRKTASFNLANYLHTEDEKYYSRFESALFEVSIAKKIRQDLIADNSDHAAIRVDFLKVHTIPEDVDYMITTFEYFHNVSDFRESINQWVISDQFIQAMEELAIESKQQIESASFSPETREEAISTLFELDKKLTLAQHNLGAALSSGTRFLNEIILWVSSSLGLILLLLGGSLSFRFLKSMKEWHRAIEISEQKYRSLFEQNPNAVCSISKDARFLQGNKALEDMTGYPRDELIEEKFDRFFGSSEINKMKKYFQKAVEGIPQTYEAAGVKKNGEHFYSEITNLPIYVDDQIIGVYGIAQDITVRKKAEKEIQKQLEEKTHLLTEVHDRVKNNLALISSLIQLQRETGATEKEATYLDSTISRIRSMAMVHERLYHTDTFSRIRMDEYVKELSEAITKSYGMDLKRYELIIEIKPVTLGISQAIPAGLLLNELLVNACKFAFENRETGCIKVTFFQENDEVVLQVEDNGNGLPDKFDLEKPITLGMELTGVLIRQLNAKYIINRENGTSFTIRFPVSMRVSKNS